MPFIKLTDHRTNAPFLLNTDCILAIDAYKRDEGFTHVFVKEENSWRCKESAEEIEAMLKYNELTLLDEKDIEEDLSE